MRVQAGGVQTDGVRARMRAGYGHGFGRGCERRCRRGCWRECGTQTRVKVGYFLI